MGNKQQTAVIKLLEFVKESIFKTSVSNEYQAGYKQAMIEVQNKIELDVIPDERQQIIDAHAQGAMEGNKLEYGMEYLSELDNAITQAETYYEQNYGK